MALAQPSGVAHALYRVFILPSVIQHPVLRLAKTSVKCSCRLPQPSLPISRPFSASSPARAKTRAPELRLQKWNEEITHSRIYLVDPQTGRLEMSSMDGTAQVFSTRQILASVDHEVERLVQVEAAAPDNDPHYIPVCRVLGKKEMSDMDQRRRKAQKEQRKTSVTTTTVKTLELNWAIDPNDLSHRLDKMTQFLGEGRRVEVVLASKKKGRKASPEECERVLERIRKRVEGIEGAKEHKEMEGPLGGFATLFFQGKLPPATLQPFSQPTPQPATQEIPREAAQQHAAG